MNSRIHEADAQASSPLSAALRQYRQFKTQYPGYVLFFLVGDFYEMFWEDAQLAARVLSVTLTSRNKGTADEIPMAGVPVHAVEGYLRNMIAAGHKVAICEPHHRGSYIVLPTDPPPASPAASAAGAKATPDCRT